MKNKAKKQFRKVVHIYCTGETEKNYVQALKQDRYMNRSLSIEIMPKLRCSFKEICQGIADDLRESETEYIQGIYLLIDLDEFYAKNKIDLYKKKTASLSKLDKSGSKLLFIETRPCIEFWFLLHYVKIDRVFSACDQVVAMLKRPGRLPSYDKTQLYTQQVYNLLKDKLGDAIQRSQEIYHKQRQNGEQYSYSKMHELIIQLDRLCE